MVERSRAADGREATPRARGPKKVDAQATSFLSLFGEESETTVDRIASAALPLHADACLVDLVGDDGAWIEGAVREVSSAGADALAKLRCRLDGAEPFGPDRVAARTAPLLLAHLGDELDAPEGAYLQRLRELGFGSMVAAPMRARGRVVGVVTLLASGEASPFDRDDAAYCEALASHAGIALVEARRREELLLAIRTRDELLASIALELRDPLATIGATVHRLARRGEVAARELLTVRRATLRIERLLEDVMALVRLRTGRVAMRLEARSPSALVRAALDDVRPLLGARELAIAAPAGEPTIRCDADGIRHVLGNLLGNAARYTPPDGHVYVEVEARQHEVVFSVRDDGPALTDQDVPGSSMRRLRTSFTSRATLSLAIARELVITQGGRLWFESAPSGSAIRLALPRD